MRTLASSCLLLTLLLLFGCGSEPADRADAGPAPPDTADSRSPEAPPAPAPTVREQADAALSALAEKDMAALAELAHPDRGVRFSPYTYIEEEHVVLYPPALQSALSSDRKYLWGAYDGTGDPIQLTFAEYYDEFIYDRDFEFADERSYDGCPQRGNTINNIADFYEDATCVEYYLDGTDAYGGMDWSSLRLLFAPHEGVPKLVGVAHSQWTI